METGTVNGTSTTLLAVMSVLRSFSPNKTRRNNMLRTNQTYAPRSCQQLHATSDMQSAAPVFPQIISRFRCSPGCPRPPLGKLSRNFRISQNCRFAGVTPRCLAAGANQNPHMSTDFPSISGIALFLKFLKKGDPRVPPPRFETSKIDDRSRYRSFVKFRKRKSNNGVEIRSRFRSDSSISEGVRQMGPRYRGYRNSGSNFRSPIAF